MTDILYKDESFMIIGSCFEVYNQMGCGFLEYVYQECLAIEFKTQNIPFTEQKELNILYKTNKLEQTYKPDFICFDKIILEIKSVSELLDEHRAQLHNYLHAAKFNLGMLVNFSHYPKLEYERIIL